MVAMFGMSEQFGMMALASRRNQYLDGGYGLDCAENTAASMDQAVHGIIDSCYRKATQILSESREDMDKVVAFLLEKETITGAEMVAILEGRDPALADQYAELEKREQAADKSADTAKKAIPLFGDQEGPAAPQEEQPDSDHTDES